MCAPKRKPRKPFSASDFSGTRRPRLARGVFARHLHRFGWPQADEVRTADGTLVGMSQYCGYTINEREFLSLVGIDEAFADPGTEVVLTWGEIKVGSRKPHVERHEQPTIRATVHTAPFSKTAQEKLRAVI